MGTARQGRCCSPTSPWALVEGMLLGVLVGYLEKVKPEMLARTPD
ncbi:MAG: hypothetical protein U0791_16195 [Gemmataceae bacterium]